MRILDPEARTVKSTSGRTAHGLLRGHPRWGLSSISGVLGEELMPAVLRVLYFLPFPLSPPYLLPCHDLDLFLV